MIEAAPAFAESTAITVAAPTPSHAGEVMVKRPNNGDAGPVDFGPACVSVALGDTVTFTPADKAGHDSVSRLQPTSATPWRSAADTACRVAIDNEGVHLEACEPRKTMGMVGVIQAGKPVNLEQAKAMAADAQAAFTVDGRIRRRARRPRRQRFDTARPAALERWSAGVRGHADGLR